MSALWGLFWVVCCTSPVVEPSTAPDEGSEEELRPVGRWVEQQTTVDADIEALEAIGYLARNETERAR